MERTTGGADSMSGGQLGVWREVCQRTAGGAFLIKRVVFI